jgi:type IV pilus assembly protein PilA
MMNSEENMDDKAKKGKAFSIENLALYSAILFATCLMLIIVSLFKSFDKSPIFAFLLFASLITGLFPLILGWASLISLARNNAKSWKYLKSFFAIIVGMVYLAILKDIVLPGFRYRSNTKQSEAKQNLGALFTAYSAYHDDYGTYPLSPSVQAGRTTYNCLSIAKWEPRGQIRYNYNCMNTEVYSPPTNDSPCPPGIITSATRDSFTIAACGNVDNDTIIDVWTINDAKHIHAVIDDVKLP